MARLVIEVKGDQAEAAMKRLNAEASKFGGTVKKLDPDVKKVERSSSDLGRTLKLLAGSVAAVQLARFARDAVDARLAMERFQRVLDPSSIKFLREESNRLGLELRSSAEAFKNLEAASRGTRLEGQAARDIFTAVAEASTVLGLRADQTSGALTAIEQIISKGVVSAEELRGQLGERLPGAFQIAARSMGVTTQELGKMLQQGEVLADDFLPRFAEEIRRTFAQELPDAMDSAQASFNRLSNAIFEVKAGVGGALLPAFNDTAKGLQVFGTNLEDVSRIITKLLFPGLISTGKGLHDFNKELEKTAGLAERLKAAGFQEIQGDLLQPLATGAQGVTDEDALEASAEVFAKIVNERLEEIREELGLLEDAIEDTEQAFEQAAREVQEAWRLEDQIREIDAAFDAISFDQVVKNAEVAANDIAVAFASATDPFANGEPAGGIPSGPPPNMEQFEEMAEQVKFLLANAIGDALTGDGGVDYQALGQSLGFIIGNAIKPGIGGAIGSVIGSLTGSLFGGGSSGPSEFEQEMERISNSLTEFIRSSLPGALAEARDLLDEIAQQMTDLTLNGMNTAGALEATNRKMQDFVNTLFGIETQLADRLLAGIEITRQNPLNPTDGGETSDQGFGPGSEGFNPMARGLSSLEPQLTEVGNVMIDLSALAQQLAGEFAGVSFEFMSIQATGNALRDAIMQLNVSQQEQAQLIAMVTEAEQIRMATLENDVLQRLVNVLQQIPGMQEESARLQQQINQARFQIEVRMIEMQLNAMGLMTEAFQQMLNAAEAFGEVLGNFSGSVGGIGNLGGINFKPPKIKGPNKADQRAREREQLLDTLERLANSPAFNSLNDRLKELNREFFGPGGFAEEARRLGVDMAHVTAAFRRQRELLFEEANRGIRQFLDGLGASSFNPGGIGAQFGSARASFFDLLGRANKGDLDARAQLGGSAQQLLNLARQRFGNTRRFQQIYEQVQGSLEGLLGDGPTTIDGQKISIARESRDLLKIIAGVDNVSPMDRADRETVNELRALRADNASWRRKFDEERKRAEQDKLDRADRLYTEIERQGHKPMLTARAGTGRM